ncbi:MAG: hypothetical protein ACYTXC_17980 [Nostoc sp.]
MNLETASDRSILYCTLDMWGDGNRTAEAQRTQRKKLRVSDRLFKLQFVGDRC